MDTLDNDVYEYDKSLFFKLLESKRFVAKFESIQEQQGVVVCPIEIKSWPFNSLDLIEKHLYLPSPYYKNHYIPLIYAPSGRTSISSGGGGGSRNSANMSESNVNLIVRTNSSSSRFDLTCDGKPICTNVKLLKIETAYSSVNSRPYRILVVDRELTFGASRPPDSSTFEDADGENGATMLDNELVESGDDSSSTVVSVSKLRDTTLKKRGSSLSLTMGLLTLKDVNTFVKAIDFLHNAVCVIDEAPPQTRRNQNNSKGKNNDHQNNRLVKVMIGENYLEEIELFKKTYVILYTHLDDFTRQAQKLFNKYVHEFSRASFLNGMPVEQLEGIECIEAVACDTALNGCLYAKLWPAVLKANERDDTLMVNRMNLLRIKLSIDPDAGPDESMLDESSIDQCVEFFRLERIYFGVNVRAVIKELRKCEMLNNPFERIESVKVSVDLLVSELTKLSMTNSAGGEKQETIMVTSENLIPLMAYVLLCSNLNHLKSAVFYVDNFNFSSMLPQTSSNSYLAELTYFMTTLKAAITFIEDAS